MVRQAIRIEEITEYGSEKLPAGPAVNESDAIIVVEGRADVLNLLKHGIKNVIAVEGTNIPKTIVELSKKKTVTAFLDGDRGGDLILKELLQVADIDYVARAPEGKGVEDLTQKEIVKSLRNKVPVEQIHVLKAKESKERKESKENKEVKEKVNQKSKEAKDSIAEMILAFKKHKDEVEGKLLARILDKNFEVIKEIPVRDLASTLKNDTSSALSIVFDGVITQRLIDIAAKKEINYLVGVRLGSVVKIPTSVKTITFDML